MEAKFTKGDWKIRACEIGVVDNSDTQSYGMMKIICTLDQYDYTEWNKNAHLIATAPEMYNMIENLSKELELAITKINMVALKNITPQTETQPDLWGMESLHDAKILLAKARGEIK